MLSNGSFFPCVVQLFLHLLTSRIWWSAFEVAKGASMNYLRGKHIITIIRESSAAIDWTLAWSVRLSSSCCMEIFSSSRFWSCTNAAWRITLHEKPMYQSLDLSRWSCCRNFLLCFAIQHLSLLDKTYKTLRNCILPPQDTLVLWWHDNLPLLWDHPTPSACMFSPSPDSEPANIHFDIWEGCEFLNFNMEK